MLSIALIVDSTISPPKFTSATMLICRAAGHSLLSPLEAQPSGDNPPSLSSFKTYPNPSESTASSHDPTLIS